MAASGTKQESLQALQGCSGRLWRWVEARGLGLLGKSWASGSKWGSKVHILFLLSSQPLLQDLPREEGDDETTNDVPHIQCEDGCDPQGLRVNSQVLR